MGHYDGVTASAYEVVFLKLSPTEAQHRLVERTALRYVDWAAPQVG